MRAGETEQYGASVGEHVTPEGTSQIPAMRGILMPQFRDMSVIRLGGRSATFPILPLRDHYRKKSGWMSPQAELARRVFRTVSSCLRLKRCNADVVSSPRGYLFPLDDVAKAILDQESKPKGSSDS
jgi:hypothetical protein